ncbi:MAG: hypothetical protein HGA67_00310 [Candidatus Yonathbacteria bacterium]|nr:hypothetical protein [Candidatus Yonathbacteria bacterium]
MTTSFMNDPRRFWPDDDAPVDATLVSLSDNIETDNQMKGSFSDTSEKNDAALFFAPQDKEAEPAEQEHQVNVSVHQIPIRRKYHASTLPREKEMKSVEAFVKEPTDNVVIPREELCAPHIPIHSSDSPLEHLVDKMDSFFKEDMEEDAQRNTDHVGTSSGPYISRSISLSQYNDKAGYPKEDEYGLIRTGGRGPSNTPAGTVIFIVFAALFIIALTFFLTAFMINMMG